MTKFYLLIPLLVAIFTSCSGGGSKKAENNTVNSSALQEEYQPKYANGFKIRYYNNHKEIEIKNPWDSTLPPDIIKLSSDSTFLLKNKDAIKIPLKRWVVLASTQISYASALKSALPAIVGVNEPQYIRNEYVKNRLKSGDIEDIGMAFSPNVEKIINADPQLIMASAFKEDNYQNIRDAGIRVIDNTSYLENTPLGRAEWLVFFASFFNEEELALSKLQDITKRYEEVKEAVAKNAENKPRVFSGKIYQGVWYCAAAQSFVANYFKDASTNYVFSDKPGTGSLNYNFETVYNTAEDADYWILNVSDPRKFSYELLQEEDSRYADFMPFKEKRIVICNAVENNYYEESILKPDVVLEDIAKAVHPELFPSHKAVFYKLME